MWNIRNETPCRAEKGFVRDVNGKEFLVVAVKGTWTLKGDYSLALSGEQDEIRTTPEYSGEVGNSTLLYDTDLVLSSLGSDIILNASAWAPDGKPATCVYCRIRVGGLEKTIRVTGNRRWKKGVLGMKSTPPEPFTTLPITYERAYGGVDMQSDNPRKQGFFAPNPVGTGFAVRRRRLLGQSLPNIEYPNDKAGSKPAYVKPAGFGAIAPDWSPRKELAGTYDNEWQERRFPLLPTDYQSAYVRSAPLDQQMAGHLKGGEKVTLENLTPEGFLEFHLPAPEFRVTVHMGEENISREPLLNTVVLEPDQGRLIMTWHTSVPCQNREHLIREIIIS